MEGGANGDSSEEWESSDDYSSDDGEVTDGAKPGTTGGSDDGKTISMATMAPGPGETEGSVEAMATDEEKAGKKEQELSDDFLDDLLKEMGDGELDDLLKEEKQHQANRAMAPLDSSITGTSAVDGLVAELKGMAEVEKDAMDGAATKVQAVFKGKKARDEVEELKVEKEEMDGAATKVQAVFKGKKARDQVGEQLVERGEQNAAAIKMQTSFRRLEAKGVLEMKRQEKEEMDSAAIKLHESMGRREAQTVAARFKPERDVQQQYEGSAEQRRADQAEKERQLEAHDGSIDHFKESFRTFEETEEALDVTVTKDHFSFRYEDKDGHKGGAKVSEWKRTGQPKHCYNLEYSHRQSCYATTIDTNVVHLGTVGHAGREEGDARRCCARTNY
jgi:hypothetical protein